jgi:hypothetical protein
VSRRARLLVGAAWVAALALSAVVLLVACNSAPTATPSGSGDGASPTVSALPSPSGPPATLAELLDSQGLRDPESGTILAKPVKRETVALDELAKRIEADPAWLAARDTATARGYGDVRYALAVTYDNGVTATSAVLAKGDERAILVRSTPPLEAAFLVRPAIIDGKMQALEIISAGGSMTLDRATGAIDTLDFHNSCGVGNCLGGAIYWWVAQNDYWDMVGDICDSCLNVPAAQEEMCPICLGVLAVPAIGSVAQCEIAPCSLCVTDNCGTQDELVERYCDPAAGTGGQELVTLRGHVCQNAQTGDSECVEATRTVVVDDCLSGCEVPAAGRRSSMCAERSCSVDADCPPDEDYGAPACTSLVAGSTIGAQVAQPTVDWVCGVNGICVDVETRRPLATCPNGCTQGAASCYDPAACTGMIPRSSSTCTYDATTRSYRACAWYDTVYPVTTATGGYCAQGRSQVCTTCASGCAGTVCSGAACDASTCSGTRPLSAVYCDVDAEGQAYRHQAVADVACAQVEGASVCQGSTAREEVVAYCTRGCETLIDKRVSHTRYKTGLCTGGAQCDPSCLDEVTYGAPFCTRQGSTWLRQQRFKVGTCDASAAATGYCTRQTVTRTLETCPGGCNADASACASTCDPATCSGDTVVATTCGYDYDWYKATGTIATKACQPDGAGQTCVTREHEEFKDVCPWGCTADGTDCAPASDLPWAPGGFLALGGPGGYRFEWVDHSADEDGFHIYFGASAANPPRPATLIATAPANATSINTTFLRTGSEVCWEVRAFNEHGESAPAYYCLPR